MNETLQVQGKWTICSLPSDIKQNDINKVRKAVRVGDLDTLKREGLVKGIVEKTNIIPTTGRNVLARLIGGDDTYSGKINYIALGSGDSAFSVASTKLNTEVYRKVVSDSAHSDNVAYIDVFIASGDVADATYKEAGAFIDGTDTADSGQAFSLVVQDFVKSGSMFISLQVTFSQA